MKNVAIVLSAGRGTRMQCDTAKQYLLMEGYPIIAHTLKVFQDSFMDEIILVCGADDVEYCKTDLVEKYNFNKVKKIIVGGKERYDSVYRGIQAIEEADYVYIHDGARPFIDQEILERVRESVQEYQACVVGMPVKDTIKIVNKEKAVTETPDRSLVWQIQTPQVFSYPLIRDAYNRLANEDEQGITDDAMVVERMMEHPIHVVEGSYQNIKITTPEDLDIGAVYARKRTLFG